MVERSAWGSTERLGAGFPDIDKVVSGVCAKVVVGNKLDDTTPHSSFCCGELKRDAIGGIYYSLKSKEPKTLMV